MNTKIVFLLTVMVGTCLCMPNVRPSYKRYPPNPKPCPCGKIYLPICASDGNSYKNPCEFKCQAEYMWNYYHIELASIDDEYCGGFEEFGY